MLTPNDYARHFLTAQLSANDSPRMNDESNVKFCEESIWTPLLTKNLV